MMNTQLFFYCFLFFILMTGNMAAAGLGVSPSSLKFIIDEGEEASRQLLIYNTGDNEASFRVESSNSGRLGISPGTVTIQAGGMAPIIVTASGTVVGKSLETIFVEADGKEDGVGLALGTAIVAEITVVKAATLTANAIVGASLSSGIVLLGLSAYLHARKRLFAGSARFL